MQTRRGRPARPPTGHGGLARERAPRAGGALAGGGCGARCPARPHCRARHPVGACRGGLAEGFPRRERHGPAARRGAAGGGDRSRRPPASRPDRRRSAALGPRRGASRPGAACREPRPGARAVAGGEPSRDRRHAGRRGDRHARGGERRQRTAARGDAARADAGAARPRGRRRGRQERAGSRREPARRCRDARRRAQRCFAGGGRALAGAAAPARRCGEGSRAARTLADRRRDLADRQQALTAWRETHVVAERARTDAAVRVAAAAERRRSFETAAARSRAAVVDVHERLASLTQRAAEAASGAEAAAAEAAASETARAAAEERAAALTLERDRLRQAIADADAALASDDAAEAGSRERLDALAQDRAGADVTLAERRLGLEHLAAQLAERYGLGLDALADVVVEDDGQDAERADHAEALRARLARLGDVNPAAAGELEELRTRREFLVAQRTDLDSSLDDLRRTIAKLNRTSRQRFEETFTAANEKLAEVFPKLFANGKARLELIPPEEGGEPGIEIVVQPAGKKLQSLGLLSGGEKALTATALILSLFLIRPTPFCLLDEVDAPLDEANIGRFNQLVREMAETSQFVLITHNRRTMEVADTLYGITMERAGISKVVAVRLREAA